MEGAERSERWPLEGECFHDPGKGLGLYATTESLVPIKQGLIETLVMANGLGRPIANTGFLC